MQLPSSAVRNSDHLCQPGLLRLVKVAWKDKLCPPGPLPAARLRLRDMCPGMGSRGQLVIQWSLLTLEIRTRWAIISGKWTAACFPQYFTPGTDWREQTLTLQCLFRVDLFKDCYSTWCFLGLYAFCDLAKAGYLFLILTRVATASLGLKFNPCAVSPGCEVPCLGYCNHSVKACVSL